MNPDPERRLAVVVRALAVAVLLCLAFSWKLWISSRLYPLVPALGLVPRFPYPLDYVVLALLAGIVAGLVARPCARPLAAAAVCLFVILFAQDQSRLWPSFYGFFLLLVLLFAQRPGGGPREARRTLTGMRFVVAAIYFWGGVQKLTPPFLHGEFLWFIRPLTDLLPVPVPGIPFVAAAAAVSEMLVGVGLLTRRFRAPALGAALLMHAVILVCIGPLRGHWNDGAWIWSQAMAVLVWLLFDRAPPFRLADMFDAPPAHNVAQGLAVVLVGVLPVLNNFNCWDSALSFNVYTGNVSWAHVVMSADAASRLPPEIAPHVTIQDGCAVLDPNAWSRREFNAGTYPEPRIFRAVFADICGRIAEPSARLLVVEKAGWFIPQSRRVHACGDP